MEVHRCIWRYLFRPSTSQTHRTRIRKVTPFPCVGDFEVKYAEAMQDAEFVSDTGNTQIEILTMRREFGSAGFRSQDLRH